MYSDPLAQDLAWEQGKRDQCVRIACWAALAFFIVLLVIWFISWMTRPRIIYHTPGPFVHRWHNLVDMKHQAGGLFFS